MVAPSAELKYFIVDAFTNRPFSGNPAAVVLLEKWKEDTWLQNVAKEMNLAETAFLVPNPSGYHLRWFTPTVEVDLCGHATLASAIALAELGKCADRETVGFSTRSGILTTKRVGNTYQLNFPVMPEQPVVAPVGLLESLSVKPSYVGKGKFDYLLIIDSEAELRSLQPDFKRLAKIDCRGVIVSTKSEDPNFDFLSRFFCPAVGVDEDPVTGSAHCCLADHWGRRLKKSKMIGYQASMRGGTVHMELVQDRVLLGGEGVIIAEGKLRVG